MAYVDEHSRSKLPSIAGVALVHVAIGGALLSGLAMQVIQRPDTPLETYPVAADPPPPPPHVEPVRKTSPVKSPVRLDPRIQVPDLPGIRPLPPIADRIGVPDAGSPTGVCGMLPCQPAQPQTSDRSSTPVPAKARGDKGDWIGEADYPPEALRAGDEGTVTLSADVSSQGRVTACRVTASSGHPALDAATCRLYQRRARYTPARDGNGASVASTIIDRVSWRIPQ